MKRALLVALLGLLASGRARAQATSATEQEIIKLEQAVTDAQFKKDRAALERLLADDYLYTHSNGSVLNKTQEIAESMSSQVQWTASQMSLCRSARVKYTRSPWRSGEEPGGFHPSKRSYFSRA